MRGGENVGRKKKYTITFIPVAGDPIEAIAAALSPNFQAVLRKHGATLKVPLVELLRNNLGPDYKLKSDASAPDQLI